MPDTKDWTWVLGSPAPSAASTPAAQGLGRPRRLIRDTARAGRGAGRSRTSAAAGAERWSPLEYACHVRDVHELFAQRVRADARRGRADLRQLGPGRDRGRARLRRAGPRGRGGELVEAAERGRRRLRDRAPTRPGPPRAARPTATSSPSTRSAAITSTTSSTTSTTSGGLRHGTVRAYDRRRGRVRRRHVGAARRACAPTSRPSSTGVGAGCAGAGDRRRAAAATPSRWRSSGCGCGARTSRPAFVALLREQGHDADVLDPLVDDLPRPGRPVRRRVGQRLTAARRACRPAHRAAAARGRHPCRRAAADVAQGGRRGRVVHARLGRRRAALHLLARRRHCATVLPPPAGGVDDPPGIGGKRSETWLRAAGGAMLRMRHTEFWARLDHALGRGLLAHLGRAHRGARPRRTHHPGGAGRRRAAQAGVGGGVAGQLELPRHREVSTVGRRRDRRPRLRASSRMTWSTRSPRRTARRRHRWRRDVRPGGW